MKTKKQLQKILDATKGSSEYYDLDTFHRDAKRFLADIRSCNITASMKVSSSGMTRRFNTLRYNMLLNVVYNEKYSWDPVKVGGCGMDMYWNLLYTTCEALLRKGEESKRREKGLRSYNSLCSHQHIL